MLFNNKLSPNKKKRERKIDEMTEKYQTYASCAPKILHENRFEMSNKRIDSFICSALQWLRSTILSSMQYIPKTTAAAAERKQHTSADNTQKIDPFRKQEPILYNILLITLQLTASMSNDREMHVENERELFLILDIFFRLISQMVCRSIQPSIYLSRQYVPN